MHAYIHTYMHTFNGTISVSQRQQGVEQVINTNIQIYSVKYYKHFTKQYYKSSLQIKSSSTQ